jgi:hypothetical protein
MPVAARAKALDSEMLSIEERSSDERTNSYVPRGNQSRNSSNSRGRQK